MADKFLEFLEKRLEWVKQEREKIIARDGDKQTTSFWGIHMTKLCLEEVILEYKRARGNDDNITED